MHAENIETDGLGSWMGKKKRLIHVPDVSSSLFYLFNQSIFIAHVPLKAWDFCLNLPLNGKLGI